MTYIAQDPNLGNYTTGVTFTPGILFPQKYCLKTDDQGVWQRLQVQHSRQGTLSGNNHHFLTLRDGSTNHLFVPNNSPAADLGIDNFPLTRTLYIGGGIGGSPLATGIDIAHIWVVDSPQGSTSPPSNNDDFTSFYHVLASMPNCKNSYGTKSSGAYKYCIWCQAPHCWLNWTCALPPLRYFTYVTEYLQPFCLRKLRDSYKKYLHPKCQPATQTASRAIRRWRIIA
eukprot:TRINITY_DN16477_c0_g1_i1.p1 TRINITY_DN16477_c0_g1~~TRINITY_DN16477_c0_g1_i1.p1  ORF type:complete len:227 (-),score=-16.95 TRINITY_DN16477_c0_g1_i1:49-729(-)